MRSGRRLIARRPSTFITNGSLIPKEAGVYAFYLDGERLYVGKGANLRSRL